MNSKSNIKQEDKVNYTLTRPISSYDNFDVTASTVLNNDSAVSPLNNNNSNNNNSAQKNNANVHVLIESPPQETQSPPKSKSEVSKFIISMSPTTHQQQQQQQQPILTTTLSPNTHNSGSCLNTTNSSNINNNINDKSQNISVIKCSKPVISDAKSKFFGFNSSNNNHSLKGSNENNNHQGVSSRLEEETLLCTTPLLLSDREESDNGTNKINISQNLNTKSLIQFNNYNSQNNIIDNQNQIYFLSNNDNIVHTTIKKQNFSQSIHIKDNKSDNLKNNLNNMDINQPSQVVYMSTTVPQNIKGSDIAGRHTPTRNSLRHSRMLVINKNFQGFKSQNPLRLKYPYLTKILLINHIVFGMLLTFLGFWILLWAPNTRLQDNPYWSGISLLFAGILGLFVIKFKRMENQQIRENCFAFLKYNSYLISLVAGILCFIALICASKHVHNLSSPNTKCTSTNILIANAPCSCVFKSNLEDNSTEDFYYRDLSCSEVFGAWKFILTVSILFNILGFIATILYIVSIFFRKKFPEKYCNIRTNSF